eukprot:UN26493
MCFPIPQNEKSLLWFEYELRNSQYSNIAKLLPIKKLLLLHRNTIEAQKLRTLGCKEYIGDREYQLSLEQNWEAMHIHLGAVDTILSHKFHNPSVGELISDFVGGILVLQIFVGNWPSDETGYTKHLIAVKNLLTVDVDI